MTARPAYDLKLTRWLLKLNAEEADGRLKQLELEQWLTPATIQITVGFLTYNAHFDLLTMSGVHFFFSRSGHIWKKLVHESLLMQPFSNVGSYIFDTIFVLQLLWLLVVEVMDMIGSIREH